MPVANVATVKPNDGLNFRMALNTFGPFRAALGVARPGPREFAQDLVLVKTLADLAQAVAYRLGVASVFNGKDLAQEVGDLPEGNEACALRLEVEPFRSDKLVAQLVTELREAPLAEWRQGQTTRRRTRRRTVPNAERKKAR